MSYSRAMHMKLAYMLSGLHLDRRDAAPVEKQKPKTVYVAQLSLRSEAVGGGAVPEDEIQFDFCVSDAERDGHYSYMTEKSLRNYAEDAEAGVPFMMDHSDGLQKQLGRSMSGSFDESSKQARATISILKDTDDTPDNMKVNEYVRRIERKYYTSCSVGFRDAQEICRLDNKPIWDWSRDNPCEHIPGQVYDGKVCEYDVDDARLREVSLVPSGSNPGAKLLDRSEWSDDLRRVKEAGLAGVDDSTTNAKSLLERDGLKWRQQLIETALAEGVRAEDGFDKAAWQTRLEGYDSDTILAQTNTWKLLGDSRWGTEGGRKTDGGAPVAGGEAKALIYPDYLFQY